MMKTILIVVLILAAFAGGYFFSQKYNFKLEEKNPQKILVGSDSDSHGCKGSAGYTWCQLKQKCLRIWEEPCVSPSPAQVPTVDETSLLKTAVKKELLLAHGDAAANLEITVSKIEGDFARGMASEQGGGGIWLAKKSDSDWQVVFEGNGVPDCQKLKTTDQFPASILTGVCD